MISLSKFVKFFQTRKPQTIQTWERVFYKLQALSLDFPDNKKFIKEFKSYTASFVTMPHQQYYEELSLLCGFKSYNHLTGANFRFCTAFNPLSNPLVKIPSMIDTLDISLVGGFSQGSLTMIGAGTNKGKTLFLINLGCNFVRQGLKVLHINLEGTSDYHLSRYQANLTKTSVREIIKTGFEPHLLKKYNKNLRTFTVPDFNLSVDQLLNQIDSIYEEFKFDVLMIDYPQLLSYTPRDPEEWNRNESMKVHQSISEYTKKLNCWTFCPFQLLRPMTEGLSSWTLESILNSPNQHIGEIANNLILLKTNQEDHSAQLDLVKIDNSTENPIQIFVRWEPEYSLFCNLR